MSAVNVHYCLSKALLKTSPSSILSTSCLAALGSLFLFFTLSFADTTHPAITDSNPRDGATDAPIEINNFWIQFSEPMNQQSVLDSPIRLEDLTTGQMLPGDWAGGALDSLQDFVNIGLLSATFDADGDRLNLASDVFWLFPEHTYRVTFAQPIQAKDLAGNTLSTAKTTFTFTTVAVQPIEVSGTISSNTTWGIAGNPYTLTGNLTVASGVTLTILPGVEVRFGGYYELVVNGQLIAEGTKQDAIFFTSNRSTPNPGDWNRILFQSGASGQFKDCIFKYGRTIESVNASLSITESRIQNFSGAGLSLQSESAVTLSVTHNDISYNQVGISLSGSHQSAVVRYNDITHNDTGVYVNGSFQTLEFNNISSNTNYELYNNTSATVQANNNYWGTTDANLIANKIYDISDNPSKGKVNYSPLLPSSGITSIQGPQNASVLINNGDAATTSHNVTLTLSADSPTPTEMIISESPTFAGASSEPYATSKSFTLSSGVGVKYVYAQFKDGSGSVSAVAFDSIVILQRTIHIATTGNDQIGDGSAANPYRTIQKGIDETQSGDIVLVSDGIYKGAGNKNLDFNGKLITVTSENGAENTVIDCENDGRGFYFHRGETSSSVVDGFTIKNGYASWKGNWPFNSGGGILCDNSSPTLTNNIITENTADWYGGGIYIWNSSALVANNVISQNTADMGGGIRCEGNSCSPTIRENTITGNVARNAGGIDCVNRSSPIINGNIISENSATGSTWSKGGGIRYAVYSSVTITNNIITGNSASYSGGGIQGDGTPTIITNNTISNNTGIGICCDTNPSPTRIELNNILNNQPYDIHNGNFIAPNNWWGTVDAAQIEDKIYDYYDDIDLPYKVEYSPILTASTTSLPTGPSNPSVIINDGAETTNSRSVTLTLSADSATQMIISESPSFDGAQWIPFSSSKSFELSSDAGVKFVYAKFKDASGNESAIAVDKILQMLVSPTIRSIIELPGRITLDIPEAALIAEDTLSVTVPDTIQPPTGLTSIDVGRDFTFTGGTTTFQNPITMIFGYPEETSNESALRLFYWDGSAWRFLGGIVDIDSNQVSAQTNHFTLFALFSGTISETSLTLKRGLNLIAIPYPTGTYTSHSLIRSISGCKVVTPWDAIGQRWGDSAFDAGGGVILPPEPFNIKSNDGYFVQVNADTTTTFGGVALTGPVTLNLKRGLNLISIPYSSGYTSHSLIQSITGCKVVTPWDATGQRWGDSAFDAGGGLILPLEPFNIEVGRGYFVQVDTDTSWTPNAPLPAPALYGKNKVFALQNADTSWTPNAPSPAPALQARTGSPVAQISNLAFPEVTKMEPESVAQIDNSFKSPQPPLLKGEKAGAQIYSPFGKGGRGDFVGKGGRGDFGFEGSRITHKFGSKPSKVAKMQSTELAKIESFGYAQDMPWATQNLNKKKRRGTTKIESFATMPGKTKIEPLAPMANDVKITDIRESNFSSSSVTVSWVTDVITDGRVRYGTTPELGSEGRGQRSAPTDDGGMDDVHWVQITGLSPETIYFYEVVSGESVDDNDGKLYTFTTSKVGQGIPYLIYGQVLKNDWSAKIQFSPSAVGAVVYVTVKRGEVASRMLSAVVDKSGFWQANLGNLKNPETNDVLSYSLGDVIHIFAQGGADGAAEMETTVSGNSPQPIKPDLVLQSSEDSKFSIQLEAGLNMISLPLKPPTSYTARSFADAIGATVVIKLDEKKFIGFTPDDPTDGFQLEGGKGYIVNVEEEKVVTFTGTAWTNEPADKAAPGEQAKEAWAFVVSGMIEKDEYKFPFDGLTVQVRNLRTGAVIRDIVSPSGYFSLTSADLSHKSIIQVSDKLEISFTTGQVEYGKIIREVEIDNIRKAFLNVRLPLSSLMPSKNALLQNYPNPFNAETWIPYQLVRESGVEMEIFNVAGQLVKTLELGHREAGYYLRKEQAVHWDGRNNLGELVASGVYFYTINAGDFVATRRLAILK